MMKASTTKQYILLNFLINSETCKYILFYEEDVGDQLNQNLFPSTTLSLSVIYPFSANILQSVDF